MGREAKARRMRQLVKTSSALTYQIHITDREAWALSVHLLHTRHKDHGEQLRLTRTVEEFGLQPTLDLLYTPEGAGLSVATFDDSNSDVMTVSRETVDFVLEQTNADMAAVHALCLSKLVTRLKDVKDGRYTAPGDTGPEVLDE